MAISINDFFKLTIGGALFKPDEVAKLAAEFAQASPGATDAGPLAQWLVAGAKISPYQAKILLAGRPGPFVYGDYRIYDRIESGRLAGIFRAIHVETKHPVCLYFLSGAAMKDPHVLASLKQQALQTYRVSVGHPNLLKCYHLAEEGPFKFLVIDDLQGKRVERLLAVKGALSVAESCRIVRQAAFGLARLHAMGQAHGDVRPANIWIAKRHVKLLLFPVYRDPLKPYTPLSEADPKGKIPPEADYIAPELAAGDRAPDARSDIYSLGCTLYHMLANQAPFAGGDLQQKLARHATEKPRPLDQLGLNIPPALAKVVNYMMAKDPELRYQQANSVVEALLPHLTPEDAQSKPEKPTRHGQAYDAWLQQKIGSDAALAAHAAAAETDAPAASVTSAPAAEPEPVAAVSAPVEAAPAVAAPVMAAPAAPVMAAPAMPSAPVMAAPVMAAPAGQFAPAMAAPAFPNAAPMFPNAAPAFPNAAPAFPGVGGPMFSNGGATFPNAAPAFPGVGPGFPNAAPMFPNAVPEPAAPAFAAPAFGAAEPIASPGIGAVGGSGTLPRRRRKSMLAPVLVIVTVLAALGGGGYYLATQSSSQPVIVENPQDKKPEVKPVTPVQPMPVEPVEPPPPPEPSQQTIWSIDDGMWASPTKGKPIDSKWVAPGAQAIIALRPAELIKQTEAEMLLDERVLGGLAPWVRTTLPALSGTRLDNIDQVLVSLLDGAGGPPKLGYVIRCGEAVPEDELLKAWGNPATEMSGETKFFQANDTGYYIPKAGEGKVVAIAPLAEMRDLVATDGEPAMRLEMEVLLKSSDADRHFTFVIAPSFLLTGGKSLYSGPAAKLRDGVDWLLMGVDASAGGAEQPTADMEPPKAVMFSAHLGEMFFAELRMFNAEVGETALGPAQMLQQRVHQLPKRMKSYVFDLDVTPYSKNVLFEFPDRIQALANYTKVGVVDKQIVTRTLLPPAAVTYITLGSYLCLLENPRGAGGGGVAAVAQAGPAAPANMTAAQKLQKKTSLSFPRNTLEVSMQLLAEDLQVPITIRGGDLQLEGITKNQSFGLDLRDKPAAEILQTIMKQANPDGKLVYIIKPTADGKGEEIFITTRAAVAKNKETLPPELELKDDKKK